MTRIAVYADWEGLGGPIRLGFLHSRVAGAGEIFDFTYDDTALNHSQAGAIQLDPRVALYPGHQYPPKGRAQFGAFSDSSPDRWGRLLMKRRQERMKREGGASTATRLHESDYLLGVHDSYRSGALRFRRDDVGPFLDDAAEAAPPMVKLRALQSAARILEDADQHSASKLDASLRMLIAPGGSLGGARPKALVIDTDGSLWIAKFPSTRDTHDVGGWEMVMHALAAGCGLNFAESDVKRFGSAYHTFLVRRFDRTDRGARLHFASAMTLIDRTDGDDHSAGASYLELADVLIRSGSDTTQDLRELWSRIVFNMLVSNTDDHLRNHGFLLKPGRGWTLSPAYDVNPDPYGDGLKLNVSESDNAQDLDLAREVAPYFRIKAAQANAIITDFVKIVSQWRNVATALGIPTAEQDLMSNAFRLAL